MVTSASPLAHPTPILPYLHRTCAEFSLLDSKSPVASFPTERLSPAPPPPCRPCEAVQPRFSLRAIEVNT